MIASSPQSPPTWKQLYEAALFETDPTQLEKRLKQAHYEIAESLRTRCPQDEKQRAELLFALRVLQDLAAVRKKEEEEEDDGT